MTSERIHFARRLRRQPTLAEDILWAQSRGSRFHGAKLKRQVPFDRAVVDFTCHAAKLVVEIDGKPHEQLAGYDEGRSEILERLALRVVRFSNEDVCNDLDSVFARSRTALRLSSI